MVYGKHRNQQTDCADMTENGVKEFLKINAQFGEHIRIDETHSIVFLAMDDSGFYGLEYWDDTYIHFVFYSYSEFIRKTGNRKVWIYDIDTTLNQSVEVPTIEAPEYTFTTLDGSKVSSNGKGYEATVLMFGSTTCSNTGYTLSEVAKSDWIKSSNIRVIFIEFQQASKEETQSFVNRYGSKDIISCYDTTSKANGAMWFYVMRYYGSASTAAAPVTVLIDGDNMIQDIYLEGAQSADDLITKINKFADTEYVPKDPYYGVNVNLTIHGMEDYNSANKVYELVNQARIKNGLTPLYLDKDLTETAMQRAAELAVYYSHVRPDGSECFTIFPHSQTGRWENIAVGAVDADMVMESWIDSPGHYANIMQERATNIGVGCFIDDKGMRYWVQCFDGYTENKETVISNRIVIKVIPTKVSFVVLNTEQKQIFSCKNNTVKTQMNIWNENAGWDWSTPALDASLFDFSSNNPSVADVDVNGEVILHGAGMAVIIATLKGEVPLSVSWTVEKKEHKTVTTETKSYCTSCGSIFWELGSGSGQNPDSPSINGNTSNLSVKQPSQGSTVVSKSAKVKSIRLSAPKKTLKAGKSMKLKAVVKTTGIGKVNTKLKWSSSRKKYAIVNQKGRVTAKKAGKGKSVTITAASNDGTRKKAKIKIYIR